MEIISTELREVRAQFAVPRRTEIVDWSGDMEDEDLIEREDMVVTITSGGYIKRTPLADFRAQRRGGKGLSGMATKDDDVVTTLFVANTHTQLLFFTTDGMVYKLKTWRLPWRAQRARQGDRQHPAHRDRRQHCRHPAGRAAGSGMGQPADRLRHVGGRCAAQRAVGFHQCHAQRQDRHEAARGRDLVNARICDENDDVMLVTSSGRAIRFRSTDVRVFKGRDSTGVRGVRMGADDRVVSMAVIRHFETTPEAREAYIRQRRLIAGVTEDDTDDTDEAVEAGQLSTERYAAMSAAEDLLLTITENGLGKLTSSHDYRITTRGGQGVGAMDKACAAARWSRCSRWMQAIRSCWPRPRASPSACRSRASAFCAAPAAA